MTLPCSLRLICFSYPPVLGGTETEAQRVAAALRARGHRVTVVCGGGAPMPDLPRWTDPYGTEVRIIGNSVPDGWRPYFFSIGLLWHLARHFFDYEICYFLMPGLHVLFGVPFARLLGKRVLMKFSGSNEIRKLTDSATGRAELALLRRGAQCIMILNPGMRQEALDAGFEPDRLRWMPNPVDTEFFVPSGAERRAQLRASLAIPCEAPVVVFVGRLSPEKELTSLFGAFARVRERLPYALLAVVGDGPERGTLTALAAQLNLTAHVVFVGRLPLDGVLEWLQASDVFALVSSREGLPCSLIEAMAAGVAPVVSDIPANLQVVTDSLNGLVAGLGDEASIARRVLELLESATLRTALAAKARQDTVNLFSTARVVEHYEAMFRELR